MFAIVCIVVSLFLEQIKAWNRIIRRYAKCNVGNGAGYKTTENNNVFHVVFFYLDLLQTWVKGCVQKMFGKTLYFSYFLHFIRQRTSQANYEKLTTDNLVQHGFPSSIYITQHMISMEFLFPGGATELKFSDLAPRPK